MCIVETANECSPANTTYKTAQTPLPHRVLQYHLYTLWFSIKTDKPIAVETTAQRRLLALGRYVPWVRWGLHGHRTVTEMLYVTLIVSRPPHLNYAGPCRDLY